MKIRNSLLLVALMSSFGCSYYSHSIVKDRTGMKFGKEVNLCPGGGVQSTKTCEPAGDGWKKADKITILQLEKGSLIFEQIDNNFILQEVNGNDRIIIHNYNIYKDEINNPKSDIKLDVKSAFAVAGNDYIPEAYVQVEIAEIYEKKAVEEAIAVIKAEAETKKIEIPASFIASVEVKLKEEIKNTKNTELTFYYLTSQYIGGFSKGDPDTHVTGVADLKPVLDKYNSGRELITGIGGFLFSKFKSSQTVFEGKMLESAIDASAKLLDAVNAGKIAEIKASASVRWSKNVNENINTNLKTLDAGIYFYPLWYKSINK